MPDDFAGDIARRCRWALTENGGDPHPAWSTGEQLIVALVLGNQAYLDGEGWTRAEAARRLAGDLYVNGSDDEAEVVTGWLAKVRAATLSAPDVRAVAAALVAQYRRWETASTAERLAPATQREVSFNPREWVEQAHPILALLAGGEGT